MEEPMNLSPTIAWAIVAAFGWAAAAVWFAIALCKAAARGDRTIAGRRMLGLSPKDAATRQYGRR
jgi:hypothetical protein